MAATRRARSDAAGRVRGGWAWRAGAGARVEAGRAGLCGWAESEAATH